MVVTAVATWVQVQRDTAAVVVWVHGDGVAPSPSPSSCARRSAKTTKAVPLWSVGTTMPSRANRWHHGGILRARKDTRGQHSRGYNPQKADNISPIVETRGMSVTRTPPPPPHRIWPADRWGIAWENGTLRMISLRQKFPQGRRTPISTLKSSQIVWHFFIFTILVPMRIRESNRKYAYFRKASGNDCQFYMFGIFCSCFC